MTCLVFKRVALTPNMSILFLAKTFMSQILYGRVLFLTRDKSCIFGHKEYFRRSYLHDRNKLREADSYL